LTGPATKAGFPAAVPASMPGNALVNMDRVFFSW
jgi:hypothetical protein